MTDENGRQLSRSVYIKKLKKYSDRKQFNIADDQLVQQNGLDNAQSEEDNSSLSDHSEYQQHHDNGDMNHDVEDNNHQQRDIGMDHDGQQDECVDNDLTFRGLDDNSLVEEMRDTSQQQGKPTIQNDDYHKVKKVYRKIKLSSGDIEYYLFWAHKPDKK